MFEQAKEYGKKGEEFFDRYVGSLMRAPVMVRGEKIKLLEGGDFFYMQERGHTCRKGFAEVKTYSNLSILKFGCKEDLTIPFELSSFEAGMDQTGKKWRPGWGIQILHWEKYNTYAQENGLQTRAVKPATLVYLFCESSSSEMFDPFSCIVFEAFEKTREQIIESAKRRLNIDLDDWDQIIKHGSAMWEGKQGIHGNEWNIPFADIADGTTTVTMIDDEPSEEAITLFSEKDKQEYSKRDIEKIIKWRRDRFVKLKEEARGRKLLSLEEEEKMRSIEKKAGCKVHRIPSIPKRLIVDLSKDSLDSNADSDSFSEKLKQYSGKDYLESDEPYYDLLRYSQWNNHHYDILAELLIDAARTNEVDEEIVRGKIDYFRLCFFKTQDEEKEDISILGGHYLWPYFVG